MECRLEQSDRHFLWEDYWTGGFDIMKMWKCSRCVFANCKLQFPIEKYDKKCYNI